MPSFEQQTHSPPADGMTLNEERFAQLERQVTQHGHFLQTGQPGFPSSKIHRRLALPIPLGSFCIGATTWLLGLLVLKVRHMTVPNGWLITGLPMGAFMTILCGIGELFTGNTFGCALFISVGGIILGLALPFLPWSGIAASLVVASGGDPALGHLKVEAASGVYLLVIWGTLFVLLIASQRTAVTFVTGLLWINIVVITFGIANMTGSETCLTAAGAFLIIVSFNLFYNATSLLLLEVGHPLARFMPLGSLARKA